MWLGATLSRGIKSIFNWWGLGGTKFLELDPGPLILPARVLPDAHIPAFAEDMPSGQNGTLANSDEARA